MVLNIYQYVLDLPRWHFMAMLFSGYLFYYFVEVVKRPILAVKDGPLKQFLIKNVPEIEMKFWPTFWCVESRAQTVFASILRASVLSNIDYRRELFTMKDGGEVALDWLETNCTSDSPIIVILPGLTGESQAEYIKCLVMSANRVGIRTVVFNQRGLGGVALKTPRMYCAAKCEDLCEVLDHVRALNPHVKMGATGISMGGLILGNYLAKHADEAEKILTSAKIISAPWNVFKGCDSIQKPYLNNMLGRHLADSLCRTVDQYEILKSKEHDWDMSQVLQSKTIKEFDSHFTAKHFGFKDVDHYYTEATMHDKLHSIKVPLLCLSAADDPFQPLDALPLQDAETSSHVCFIVTARGVLQSKTIKEFDSHFTAKHFGFKDVDHYYTEATMHDKLHSIKVPLLCLSAADDPFQPLDALPLQDAETSSHVCFIVTARGGHIAFLEGWWPTSREQYMSRLFSQFFSVTLNDKDHEFEKISEQLKQDVKLCE
uniref:CSON011682 protein n=1 Tax=Culicoides sonorensis TaxID=179676 RepID=A0A336M4K4_CULSO